MKPIIFTAILILAFCLATFAQANENQLRAAKISEYWEDPGSEEVKFAIDELSKELQKSQSAEGIIKIQAKTSKEITRRLMQIKRLLTFRQVDLTHISFAINDKDKEIIQYWFAPAAENIPDCGDCIIIRAEDYDKLANFFNPKPKLKKRRK